MDTRYPTKLSEALQDYINALYRDKKIENQNDAMETLAGFIITNLDKKEATKLCFHLDAIREDSMREDFEPKTPTSIKDLNLKSPLSL